MKKPRLDSRQRKTLAKLLIESFAALIEDSRPEAERLWAQALAAFERG
jgi:hypothetical protein